MLGPTRRLLSQNFSRDGRGIAAIPESSRISIESNARAKISAALKQAGSVASSSLSLQGGISGPPTKIPELAVMADVLNPEHVETKPLNTELENPTLEAAGG